ncbi:MULTISPECIES: hypothetical protein [Streptomyces]|uniref:Uncharacterized protein n=1 Tax=Streptomyces nondiastaticus TaxID=3154512 RepID=A0ABW6U6T9_9ACTN|nr:hypothetical protein [Streptomyces sp. VNUA116]WKU44001.1 hypothetical protein Q3V23_07840 [Streptomyces sp. VNUA116]
MAETAGRTAGRARGQRAAGLVAGLFAPRPAGTRHPLVAAAMVVPLAAFLAFLFGGWDAVVTQASSVAGMLGR